MTIGTARDQFTVLPDFHFPPRLADAASPIRLSLRTPPAAATSEFLFECIDADLARPSESYSAATGLAAFLKSGGRFSRNAAIASLASAERTRWPNS